MIIVRIFNCTRQLKKVGSDIAATLVLRPSELGYKLETDLRSGLRRFDMRIVVVL